MAKVYYLGHAVEHEAGETLGGHRVVVIIGNQAFYADNTNLAHKNIVRGITVSAVTSGGTACIQIGGPLVEPSWNWTPGLPLYVSTNGMLTQSAPTSGFIQKIGVADTSTQIIVTIHNSLVLI